jgi:hypothetical protein
MRIRLLATLFCLTALGLNISSAVGANAHGGQYQNIEVMRFDTLNGIDFPPDYLATMMEELVHELGGTNRFQQVLREGETPAEANTPTVQLVGTVTEFAKGNRAVRYMVGFGAGKTKVKAHVKFIDSATGRTVLEKDVDGKVWIGFIGGESIGATRGLAKEVAKVAKRSF